MYKFEISEKIDTNVRYVNVNVKFVNVKIYFDFLSSIVSSYHVRITKSVTAIKRLKNTFPKEFKSNLNKFNFFFNNVYNNVSRFWSASEKKWTTLLEITLRLHYNVYYLRTYVQSTI